MSEMAIFVLIGAIFVVVVLVLVMFRKPISTILGNAESGSVEVSKDKFFRAEFSRKSAALQKDAEDVEKAAGDGQAGSAAVEPTSAELTLPRPEPEQVPDPASVPVVKVRDLVEVGADWGGLISKANKFLEAHDIPAPQEKSSLGALMRTIYEDWPKILPEGAVKTAATADELLEALMQTHPGEIPEQDIRKFSSALASLHRTLDKTASKARHPGYFRG